MSQWCTNRLKVSTEMMKRTVQSFDVSKHYKKQSCEEKTADVTERSKYGKTVSEKRKSNEQKIYSKETTKMAYKGTEKSILSHDISNLISQNYGQPYFTRGIHTDYYQSLTPLQLLQLHYLHQPVSQIPFQPTYFVANDVPATVPSRSSSKSPNLDMFSMSKNDGD